MKKIPRWAGRQAWRAFFRSEVANTPSFRNIVKRSATVHPIADRGKE